MDDISGIESLKTYGLAFGRTWKEEIKVSQTEDITRRSVINLSRVSGSRREFKRRIAQGPDCML